MTSSQPLTDAGLEAIRDRDAADFVTAPESVSGLMGHEVMQARVDRRALLAEVSRLHAELVHTTKHLTGAMRVVREEADRLRAENTALAERIAAFLEPHKLVARNIAWFDQEGVLHVTEHTVCDHCVPKFAQFNRREDIPEGPCEVRRALGLDQDGEGQANAR